MFKKWITISFAATLLLSGCSKEKVEVGEHKEKKVEEETVKEEVIEIAEDPFHYPLTGIGSEKEIEGRAFAVMINNFPQARPQSGIQKADVVYELLAEGNVTRFLAIFQSETGENIGPVRSARDYFIDLAKGYDALYIAHGYSPEAKKMLQNGTIDNLNGMQYDGSLFKRASFRKAPHNSYITFDNVQKGAKQVGYNMDEEPKTLTFLTDEEVEQLTGSEAKKAFVTYSSDQQFNVQYEYDETLKKYKRYSNGDLTADYDTKDPVLLDNVFVVETSHKIIDDKGRRNIDLTSGGKGYLLQRGKWNEVEWKSVDGRILPFKNNEEVGLVPGKTWINVIPTNPGLEKIVTFN
ncbi:DUF3048 domain-containing protein [Bacillus sp. 31A1R]|uniref:DUF3048 domain-containing protein n=1 Tax=Robertmurraya mangrovi TaxID=3098077 RepID=A0ABU5J5B6_9BACI|nr:DUF3048 domain-containing protein [Bacillus sp. 31A1R]MDZ5474614.1 DUF3048 domain-containing protein [Bacillus sp. 31A1R]